MVSTTSERVREKLSYLKTLCIFINLLVIYDFEWKSVKSLSDFTNNSFIGNHLIVVATKEKLIQLSFL